MPSGTEVTVPTAASASGSTDSSCSAPHRPRVHSSTPVHAVGGDHSRHGSPSNSPQVRWVVADRHSLAPAAHSSMQPPAKVAPTTAAPAAVTTHAPVPVHAPVQPVKVAPCPGVAVRVTWVPAANDAWHDAPQSIPAGADVTAPAPVRLTVIVGIGGIGASADASTTGTTTDASTAGASELAPLPPPHAPSTSDSVKEATRPRWAGFMRSDHNRVTARLSLRSRSTRRRLERSAGPETHDRSRNDDQRADNREPRDAHWAATSSAAWLAVTAAGATGQALHVSSPRSKSAAHSSCRWRRSQRVDDPPPLSTPTRHHHSRERESLRALW